jgi:hypothetical protein
MGAPVDGQTGASSPRWVYPAALALVLFPFVVAMVASLLDGGHTAIADRALMELRTRDVGRHPVTIGLYSRDGWSHPGPLVYYLLAVPYRLFGSDMNALMVGSLMINAAAVASMGIIAKRIAGVGACLAVLVAASAVVRALGTAVLVDPWVCWITIVPFGTFCILTWAMADGRTWALPATALVASFLTQTHVGFAPITLPATVVGAVWLVVRVVRHDRGRLRRLIVAAVGTVIALAVVWAPPVWNQWRGSGNLDRLIDWFRDNSEPAHTLAEGVRIVGGQFAVVPDWITGTRRVVEFSGASTLLDTTLIPLLLIPFVVAGIVAFRRRDRIARSLLVMLAVTLVAAVVSVAQTTGTMYEYRLLWTWTLGALVSAATGVALWRALRHRLPAISTRVVTAALLATLVGLTAAQTADALDADRTYDWDSPEVAEAVARAERHLSPDAGQLVLASRTFVGNWYAQGVLLAFEHDGYDVRVPSDDLEVFGQHRVRGDDPVQADLLVLANTDLVGYEGVPGYRPIGFGAAGSFAETVRVSNRLDRAHRRLGAGLDSGRITGEEWRRRVRALPAAPTAVLILERTG